MGKEEDKFVEALKKRIQEEWDKAEEELFGNPAPPVDPPPGKIVWPDEL